MKTRIVLTGILRDNDLFLVVKRNENDDLYPGVWEFPGGHLEENETFEECLKREVSEETGIELDDSEIKRPFMKVVYMNKDWPEVGKNRKAEIYRR